MWLEAKGDVRPRLSEHVGMALSLQVPESARDVGPIAGCRCMKIGQRDRFGLTQLASFPNEAPAGRTPGVGPIGRSSAKS
jgi:hypothetical protein